MTASTRRAYEPGHQPKFMAVVDDTPECAKAVRFAARRAARIGSRVLLAAIVAPPEFSQWLGVGDVMQAEAEAAAERRLEAAAAIVRTVAGLEPEKLVRTGQKAEEILRIIEQDEDVAILILAALHLRLLAWNLGQFARFRRSAAMTKLRTTNGESQLLTLPLAIAMAINVGFILGLVLVPGLWSVVEYLFPLAMAAFLATGLLALAQIGRFYGRVFGKGGFDWAGNNSFAQVMPAFALGMVGVGLSASAALSAMRAGLRIHCAFQPCGLRPAKIISPLA
jgi:nucleotide-binding universal stress UspA family protein